MIRTLRPWSGFGLALAAILFLLASANRDVEWLNGAIPVGEDTLIAARGLMPNYLSSSGNYICCLANMNSINVDNPDPYVCLCFDQDDGTNCLYCKGPTALSGYYSAGAGSSVQPSGGTAYCSDSLELFTGSCLDGDCVAAGSGLGCGFSYPTFGFQTRIEEGHSLDGGLRLATTSVNRR